MCSTVATVMQDTSDVTKALDAETEAKTEAGGFETEAEAEAVAPETETEAEAQGSWTNLVRCSVFRNYTCPKKHGLHFLQYL